MEYSEVKNGIKEGAGRISHLLNIQLYEYDYVSRISFEKSKK